LYSDMVYQVSEQKPAQLVLFDYYDPEQQVKTNYVAKQSRSLQDACPDCWPTALSSEKSTGIQTMRARAARNLHASILFALLFLIAFQQ
uniref:A2M_recep domain-containing protein n=1 Tax=Gongylonema pulchrum TaxID=637853 RepID=A0A183D111_9BILA